MKKCAICLANDKIMEEYPIQDNFWPSRRWKDDKKYCDMSGGCTCGQEDFNSIECEYNYLDI